MAVYNITDRDSALELVSQDGLALYGLPQEFKKDFGIASAAIEQNAQAFHSTDDELKDNEEFILKSLSLNGRTMSYASNRLKNDKKFIMKALYTNPSSFQFASEEVRNDRDFILELNDKMESRYNDYSEYSDIDIARALKYMGNDLKADKELYLQIVNSESILRLIILTHMSEEIRDNYDLVLTAVKRYGGNLESASKQLQDNDDIVAAAVKNSSGALKFASPRLKNNFDIVMTAVKSSSFTLLYAGEEMQDNFDIVMTAVTHQNTNYFHPDVIESISDRLRNDFDISLAIVKKRGSDLEHLSPDMRDNFDIVAAAVQSNGSAIQHASEKFRTDRELILKLLKSLPQDSSVDKMNEFSTDVFLQYIDEKFCNDKEVVLEAVKYNGMELQYAGQYTWFGMQYDINDDEEIVHTAVSNNGNALRYASSALRGNKTIALAAIKDSLESLAYISEDLKGDKEFVWEILKSCEFPQTTLRLHTSVLKGDHLLSFIFNFLQDRDIVLSAVKCHGNILQHLNKEFQSDQEIVTEAVKSSPFAWQFANQDLRNNEEVIQEVDFSNYKYNYNDFVFLRAKQTPPALLLKALKISPWFIMQASDELKNDEEYIMKAINISPQTPLYFPDKVKHYSDKTLLTAFKQEGKVAQYIEEEFNDDFQQLIHCVSGNFSDWYAQDLNCEDFRDELEGLHEFEDLPLPLSEL